MAETPHNADYRPQASHASAARGHEPESTSIRAITIFFIALVLSLIVIAVSMVILFDALESEAQRVDPPPSPFRATRPLPPDPRLQINHVEDMQLLREHQERLLNAFSWVDRDAGIVRLPIEHAMRLYAEQAPQRQQMRDAAQQQQQQQQQAQPQDTTVQPDQPQRPPAGDGRQEQLPRQQQPAEPGQTERQQTGQPASQGGAR